MSIRAGNQSQLSCVSNACNIQLLSLMPCDVLAISVSERSFRSLKKKRLVEHLNIFTIASFCTIEG